MEGIYWEKKKTEKKRKMKKKANCSEINYVIMKITIMVSISLIWPMTSK